MAGWEFFPSRLYVLGLGLRVPNFLDTRPSFLVSLPLSRAWVAVACSVLAAALRHDA